MTGTYVATINVRMIKKLTTTGNSAALVLDRGLLEEAHIALDALVEVVVVNGTICITAARAKVRRDRFETALKETNRRWGGALKRLAE